MDGVMRTKVEVDGLDATEKIASMIMGSPHYDQLRVVILDGVTLAGFNVVDLKALFERTRLPAMSVAREKPDFAAIRKALKNLPESRKRWEAMENAGKLIEVQPLKAGAPIYVQLAGLSEVDARRILKKTSTRSNIPEALRVAHMIASGLTRSEEKV